MNINYKVEIKVVLQKLVKLDGYVYLTQIVLIKDYNKISSKGSTNCFLYKSLQNNAKNM